MPNSSTEFQTTCIVLTSASGREAGELSRTLAERQWTPIIVNDPLAALAEAAIRVRAQASQASDGKLRAQPTIAMAICEQWMGEHVRDRDRLLQAICRYLPAISLWAYEGEKLMPLRTELRSEFRAESSKSSHSEFETPDSVRAKREADVIITRREMDMLLQSAAGSVGGES
jgi:hypothetical protein